MKFTRDYLNRLAPPDNYYYHYYNLANTAGAQLTLIGTVTDGKGSIPPPKKRNFMKDNFLNQNILSYYIIFPGGRNVFLAFTT